MWSGDHKFTENERFEITDDITNNQIEIIFKPNSTNTEGKTLLQVVLRYYTQLKLECIKDERC